MLKKYEKSITARLLATSESANLEGASELNKLFVIQN